MVRRAFAEADGFVHGDGLYQQICSVEPHEVKAIRFGRCDQRFAQLAAGAMPMKLLAHIQAFHLANTIAKIAICACADDLSMSTGEQRFSVRWAVLGRQRRQLSCE